jgi:hypothetical protein
MSSHLQTAFAAETSGQRAVRRRAREVTNISSRNTDTECFKDRSATRSSKSADLICQYILSQ